MFRRNEKNKIRASFKLEFHATQVTRFNGEKLMVSVVPSDAGKPIVRLEKSVVKDGKCRWENAVYETVKFDREPKSGELSESIYQFILSAGSGKGGFVGEVSVDLANYVETTKGSSVALPLKNSSSDAILHVYIQKLLEDGEREAQEDKDLKVKTPNRSLRSHFIDGNKDDSDHSIESSPAEINKINKIFPKTEANRSCRASSGSDITATSSESSSEIGTPRENVITNGVVGRDHNNLVSSMSRRSLPNMRTAHESMPTFEEENGEARWDSFSSLDQELMMDLQETDVKAGLEKNAESEIERLKAEIAAMARQADLSDLELQTLRKQIVKECKKSQDLTREIVCLKDKRDALDAECSNLRASRDRLPDTRPKNVVQFDGGDDMRAILAEVRQELNFEKNINADLRIQLQKTQESNAELMLAVKDLDEMLIAQGSQDVCAGCDQFAFSENHERSIEGLSRCETDEDEEQKALEELVKEHQDAKETYLLEQKILDLNSEIEIYRRDRDELEMQMEQLELDYEILKQKSHEMSVKLEQSQLQEQLKLQYEVSPAANVTELRATIESLESELSGRSKEFSDSVSTIREMEARIRSLEEELEKKGEEFVADLEIATRAKVEQERRAIQVEKALKKLMRKNADTADRLQEELQRLSEQMASTIDASEKLAMRSMAKSDELRAQKGLLEQTLKKANEELHAVQNASEAKVGELSEEIKVRTDRMERMSSEIDEKAKMLDDYEKREKEASSKFLKDIQCLKSEILALSQEKTRLSKLIEEAESSSKEAELLVQRAIKEKSELENAVALTKKQLEDSLTELKYAKDLKDKSDRAIACLRLEIRTARVELNDTKNSLIQSDIEKEYLQKQVFQLRGEVKKKNDEIKDVEKALHNGHSAEANRGKGNKMRSNNKVLPDSTDDEEISSLRGKLQFLEGEIKLKEAALEDSANLFSDKEKDFVKKIEELEDRLEGISGNGSGFVLNPDQEVAADKYARETYSADDGCQRSSESVAAVTCACRESPSSRDAAFRNNEAHYDKLEEKNRVAELDLILEKNKSMEAELKELQEKYSEMSLKFAEVEGERQQLVMTLRNIKNSKKI